MIKHYPTLLDCIIGDFYDEFNIVPEMDLIYTESFTNRNLKTDPIKISLKDLDGVHIELIAEQPPQEITINFNENKNYRRYEWEHGTISRMEKLGRDLGIDRIK